MNQSYTVAISMNVEGAAQRGIARGVIRFALLHPEWQFAEHEGYPTIPSPQLLKCRCDGLITTLNSNSDLRVARRIGVPVVGVARGREVTDIPMVISDDAVIGRLGAAHLLERGFRHFAYYGSKGYQWSADRGRGFCQAVQQAGFLPHQTEVDREQSFVQYLPQIKRWLLPIPRPLAIMVSDDQLSRHVLSACHQLGLRVPDDVAVLGVDNSDMLCDLANPPLSSIMQDTERIGYKAAALLHRLMQGKRAPSEPTLIPPRGIVVRRSTDVLAVEDTELSRAIRLIRDNATGAFSVKQLLAKTAMSRRTLERKFLATLRRRPAEEIRRVRIERLSQLLRATSLSISEVARSTGFPDVRALDVFFRREMKQTPSDYRARFRD